MARATAEVSDAARLEEVRQRSPLGVQAEPRSTHRLLIKLEQFGHRLLAHFHSHPGRCAEATHPSGIGRNF